MPFSGGAPFLREKAGAGWQTLPEAGGARKLSALLGC